MPASEGDNVSSQTSVSSAIISTQPLNPSQVSHSQRQNKLGVAKSGSSAKSVKINVPNDPNDKENHDGNPSLTPQSVLWGTNVVTDVCLQQFKRFVITFIPLSAQNTLAEPNSPVQSTEEPSYSQAIDEVHMIGDYFVNLNCMHLKSANQELYKQLITYPREIIPIFDIAINEIYTERYPNDNLSQPIQVRPYNPGETSERPLRLLEPVDLDKIVQVSGMVTRVSNLIPEMRRAYYQCEKCNHFEQIEMQSSMRFEEPRVCVTCRSQNLFKLIHNMSHFSDRQVIKLQEDPSMIPAGETPQSIIAVVHDDLIDQVQPGDRIDLTGIYKAAPMKVDSKHHAIRSVYRTYVDVLHIKKMQIFSKDSAGAQKAAEDLDFTDADIQRIREISRMPNVFDKLSKSLAPAVFGNEDIKKGILLQLLGGTIKEPATDASADFKGPKIRSELNILLCGDPGTSKSQLLKYVYDLVPRAQYTSGKGSSAVGLTAYITKDADTKDLVLQSGALVLADKGICCIDEFDKMSEHIRSVLHEVMEQQTMSIAKAGIICSLNARVAILAAANPVDSHWNPKKTIIDNLKLPSTLLSRFDLIFLVLDPQSEEHDRRLAGHLVDLFTDDKSDEFAGVDMWRNQESLSIDDVKKYIAYAKSNVNPKLTREVSQKLTQAYVQMRQANSAKGHVSAFPRQLESLIRLSEAHAKARLSPIVETEDVDEAMRLHREALRQSATDPTTGRIDVSILTTGVSSVARKQYKEIANAIRTVIDSLPATKLNMQNIYEELSKGSDLPIKRIDFESAMKLLVNEGYIKVGAGGDVRVILHSV